MRNTGGIPLKILPHVRYEEGEILFQEGDQLFLYTDGLTEAFNPDHDMFGQEALEDLIKRYGQKPPDELVKEILRSVHAFVRNEPFHDDLTMVSILRKTD
jgi:sigma-B regulation protein RsbU (phosphoserine phosphatase)